MYQKMQQDWSSYRKLIRTHASQKKFICCGFGTPQKFHYEASEICI